MIVETIFSTLDPIGQPNFAPMGVILMDDAMTIRPYRDTQTCRNILSTRYGVVNISDDVLAYVQSGLYHTVLPHVKAQMIPGVVFLGACSWREVEVIEDDGSPERAEFHCRELYRGWNRDFLGFCRARNAVIEAAILATRIHLHDKDILMSELEKFRLIVEKTGDDKEKEAFSLVRDYVNRQMNNDRD